MKLNMTRYWEHMEKRKRELADVSRAKLINMIIVGELERDEYEKDTANTKDTTNTGGNYAEE